jgi:hypothetical protein
MGEIYALFSTRNGMVRYVGKTTGTIARRFRQHAYDCESIDTWVLGWLHQESKRGYPVEYVRLASCPDAECEVIETEWMNKFPNLLNVRKYRLVDGNPPVIPEIEKYMRSHLFNVNGFRGIHYSKQLERYSVFVYTGTPAGEWLTGDEFPGCPQFGSFWFLNRTEALLAREGRRKLGGCFWLPDYDVETDFWGN